MKHPRSISNRPTLIAMAMLLATTAQAQHAAPAELQGTWVPTKATCESPARVVVGANQLTLINGSDKEVVGGAEMAGPAYWGPDYNGIMAVMITEFDGQQPVTMSFNVGEKKGVGQVEFSPVMTGGNAQQAAYNKRISQLNLLKRFPLNKVPLKKCGAESGAAPAQVKQAKAVPAGPSLCAGVPHCVEVTPFAATVTDFRNSNAGSTKVVTINMRLQNRTAAPLILGYVQGSGIVTDDQGNRYGVSGRVGVRGIGEISGNTFDPKFVLQPGEASDARFEFQWTPAQGQIFGTSYDVEVALREIEALPANQYRLGKEYALKLDGFGGAKAATATTATSAPATSSPAAGTAPSASGAATTAAAVPASTASDACAGKKRCYNAGPFAAEVTQVTVAKAGGYQVISLKVKVQNIGAQPLILGFQSRSGTGSDDVGNRVAANDGRVKGIGLVSASSADPQFGLNPGQARTFNIDYQLGIYRGTVLGTAWNVDFVLEQLEVLPSRQVRSVRDYAVSFTDLTAGNGGGAGGAPASTAAAGDGSTAPATTSDSSAAAAVNATTGAVKAVGKLFKK